VHHSDGKTTRSVRRAFGDFYGFTALACARGFADARVFGLDIVPATGTIATAIALAAIIFVVAAAWRIWPPARPRDILGWLTVGCAAVAAVTIVFVALPLALVPVCQ